MAPTVTIWRACVACGSASTSPSPTETVRGASTRSVAARGGALSIAAVGPARVEPWLAPRLCVAFALTKGTKPEVVVRQLTELGVDALTPVIGERSVARRDVADEARLVERLERVAREASMQSRRARLPEISRPSPLLDLVGRPGLVLADRTGSGGAPPAAAPEGWTLLVGPEGGLSTAELEALDGVPRVGVGSHVLRAETAAVAVAALLAAAVGRPVRPESDHGGWANRG